MVRYIDVEMTIREEEDFIHSPLEAEGSVMRQREEGENVNKNLYYGFCGKEQAR